MQDHDFDSPFSPRELRVSLGVAVLWVLVSAVAVQLWLLPVQGV